jgi:hypothetical protein
VQYNKSAASFEHASSIGWQLVLACVVCGASKNFLSWHSLGISEYPSASLFKDSPSVAVAPNRCQRRRERIAKVNKCVRERKDRWKPLEMKFKNVFFFDNTILEKAASIRLSDEIL